MYFLIISYSYYTVIRHPSNHDLYALNPVSLSLLYYTNLDIYYILRTICILSYLCKNLGFTVFLPIHAKYTHAKLPRYKRITDLIEEICLNAKSKNRRSSCSVYAEDPVKYYGRSYSFMLFIRFHKRLEWKLRT